MRILIVDDLEEGRYYLEQALKANGYEVASARNGLEAMDLLRSQRFDAILSDIMMPGMDGFELCHNVKSDPALRTIPLLFYTATYTSDEDERFALSLGADAFIIKPQAPEDLLPRIHDVLSRARAQTAPFVPPRLSEDHLTYLREYNARLVSKLEEKVREVEVANRRLAQTNESLEARVRLRTAQLEETNNDLETFAFSIAHDLRAQLRSMTSFAGLLAEDLQAHLSPQTSEYLNRIQQSGARMSALIEDILSFSKSLRAELKLEPSDLDSALNDILQSHEELRPPATDLRVRSPLGKVMGNRAALQQCLLNLLSNAAKYVVNGSKPQITIRSEPRGPVLRLWVEDKGIGIPKEAQSQLFQMFHRLHSADEYEGTGLGLSIVRKTVERMGGRVGVESEPGAGSRFWIELTRSV